MNNKVAVIGGGPSGMIASAFAAKNGNDVTLFEKNEKLGKKLFLTGKGRCNITNSAPIDDFLKNIPKNPRFLYSAFNNFTNEDIIKIIESNGVATKVERGGRVFPQSDKSSDVIKALTQFVKKSGVHIELNCEVKNIEIIDNDRFVISTNGKKEQFDKVIICTGGISYTSTGSTGDGYRFAQMFGHKKPELKASLTALVTQEKWPCELMGLSLKNIKLKVYNKKNKIVYDELGEMLFTHFGVSGPLVLSASSIIADEPRDIFMSIDLKPALSEEELDRRVLRDFEKYIRKQLVNALVDLLPSRLIPIIIEQSGLDAQRTVDNITKAERSNIVHTLKHLEFHIEKAYDIEQAIITRGGISVKEINASTMESKLVKGLYFAGEVIDVDAFTGGFNLQIAYSTGALAGSSV